MEKPGTKTTVTTRAFANSGSFWFKDSGERATAFDRQTAMHLLSIDFERTRTASFFVSLRQPAQSWYLSSGHLFTSPCLEYLFKVGFVRAVQLKRGKNPGTYGGAGASIGVQVFPDAHCTPLLVSSHFEGTFPANVAGTRIKFLCPHSATSKTRYRSSLPRSQLACGTVADGGAFFTSQTARCPSIRVPRSSSTVA